jgi:hypothetical protein
MSDAPAYLTDLAKWYVKDPPPKCAGVRLSGYWKGWSCGARPTVEHEGRGYCAGHYTVAVYQPHRFEEAKMCRLRAETRAAKVKPA